VASLSDELECLQQLEEMHLAEITRLQSLERAVPDARTTSQKTVSDMTERVELLMVNFDA
jgi:hypothetical protein